MSFPHIIYGGDYNPDQWTPEIWQEDARLMRRLVLTLFHLASSRGRKWNPSLASSTSPGSIN